MPEASPNPSGATRPGSKPEIPRESPIRVLIVDDHDPVRRGIRLLLSSVAKVAVVGEATDGVEAIEKAEELRPDLVLMDITMPRMDGLQATRAIKASQPETRVIIVSQNEQGIVQQQAAEVKADGFVGKSELSQQLIPAIGTLFGKAAVEAGKLSSALQTARPALKPLKVSTSSLATLRERRERLELMAQASEIGFWFCDLPFGKLIWDDRVKEHFWYPPETEVDIEMFYQRLHPEDRERTRETIEQCIAKRQQYDIEYRTVADDGRIKWIRAIGSPFFDDSGAPTRFDGLTIDVTGKRQAEETTGLLAAIVASSDDAIVSKNLNGVITSWNKSAERVFGYTAQEAVGRHITLIIPRDRLSEEVEILSRIRRGERVDHFETVRVRKDGTTIELSLTISPVLDREGRVIGASKVARDISERKRAERALRESEERERKISAEILEAHEKYRQLSESLDAEVRVRTGELEKRNTDVLNQSDQLRELSRRLLRAQDEERRHIARELHDSAGQTLTVLGMSVSQLVQQVERDGNSSLAPEAALIQNLVQQLHREIRTASYLLHPPMLDENGLGPALGWYVQGLSERSGLEIKLDIATDFGRLPRDMELAVFRLVQECLTNIHRHSGSRTASIRIERNDDTLTVAVRDEGRGITPGKLAELQSGASGVGIRGMRERLRHFQGKLNIESSDKGTAILADLPLPKQPPVQKDAATESAWQVH